MQKFDQVEKDLRSIIQKVNPNVFVVEYALHRGGNNVLSICVDTDQGITIDECARISRKMNVYFEEEDPFDFPFKLEVSSPGVGKPLKLHRQYHQNIGRKLKVTLLDGQNFKGKLELVDDEGIVLRPKPKKKKKNAEPAPETIRFEFEKIKEAKVEISFD